MRLSPAQHRAINQFLLELSQWNKVFNLTGLRDPDQMVRHLLLDSLICASRLPERGLILDIGSGAGFPAVPIKIYHATVELHLLEPNRRRASFLKHIKRVLSLESFRVSRGRLEEQGTNTIKPCTAITARAVMDPLKLIPKCAPLLATGGRLVLFLGQGGKSLEAEIARAGKDADLVISQLLGYKLPGAIGERFLAFLNKGV